MDELRNYDKETLTTERRKSLKRYVDDENMSVDRLRKVSRSLERVGLRRKFRSSVFGVLADRSGRRKRKPHGHFYATRIK